MPEMVLRTNLRLARESGDCLRSLDRVFNREAEGGGRWRERRERERKGGRGRGKGRGREKGGRREKER